MPAESMVFRGEDRGWYSGAHLRRSVGVGNYPKLLVRVGREKVALGRFTDGFSFAALASVSQRRDRGAISLARGTFLGDALRGEHDWRVALINTQGTVEQPIELNSLGFSLRTARQEFERRNVLQNNVRSQIETIISNLISAFGLKAKFKVVIAENAGFGAYASTAPNEQISPSEQGHLLFFCLEPIIIDYETAHIGTYLVAHEFAHILQYELHIPRPYENESEARRSARFGETRKLIFFDKWAYNQMNEVLMDKIAWELAVKFPESFGARSKAESAETFAESYYLRTSMNYRQLCTLFPKNKKLHQRVLEIIAQDLGVLKSLANEKLLPESVKAKLDQLAIAYLRETVERYCVSSRRVFCRDLAVVIAEAQRIFKGNGFSI